MSDTVTLHRATSAEWPSRDTPYARKREANDYMRQGLQRLDPDERIPFFCECGRPDCYAAVWLTSDAFDQARAGSSPVFARRHDRGAAA